MNDVLSQETYDTFYFVELECLRKNLANSLYCATELMIVAKVYPKNVRHWVYKLCVINLTSILEALLHYYLINNLKGECIDTEWIYRDIKIIYSVVNDQEEAISGIRHKKKIKVDSNINLRKLNALCRKNNFITERQYNKIDKVRIIRNKIHLINLNKVDKNYTKKDIDMIANLINRLIKRFYE